MTEKNSPRHYFGKAPVNSTRHNGWFLGRFMPSDDPFHYSRDVELKWGRHQQGEQRTQWAAGDGSHSVSLLVKGHFKIMFNDTAYELKTPGDYVIWQPDTPHTWKALADSVVLTVRWPSNGAA